MYITVVGGGNSTPIFAALAQTAGHTVAILTRRPSDWDANSVGFVNDDPGYCNGVTEMRVAIALVTDDPAKCIPQSDMIFLAGIPIHHNPEVRIKAKTVSLAHNLSAEILVKSGPEANPTAYGHDEEGLRRLYLRIWYASVRTHPAVRCSIS